LIHFWRSINNQKGKGRTGRKTHLKKKIIVISAATLLVIILIVSIFGIHLFSPGPSAEDQQPDVFVGVDIGYGDENDLYNVVGNVSGSVNLIIIGSLEVTEDTPTLLRVCDYLYDKGLYFIIYIGFAKVDYLPPRGPTANFFNTTVGRWGDKFLGAYVFDEVGGKQLDAKEKPVLQGQIPDIIMEHRDYTYVSETYVAFLSGDVGISVQWYTPPYPKLFTSDYGLYWFDYVSGYDNIFAEFVGNNSRQIAVSLCRGAAHCQSLDYTHTRGQDWGVMITWKYDVPPFLEGGEELFNDMMLAYENDAKYIVVFNSAYPQNNTTPLGILTQDHIDAMKRFWNDIQKNPRGNEYPADTAYVLPKDYGFGMRRPDDTIWGLWTEDGLSPIIWSEANSLVDAYGRKIDIVYETRIGPQPINLPYSNLIFWNGTIMQKSIP
jgi:hypothetical protein